MEGIKEKLKRFPFWAYILRGIGIFFMVLAIKSVIGIRVLTIYEDMKLNFGSGAANELPFFAISIIYFVGTFFLLNSVLNLFSTYDRRTMERFIEAGHERVAPLASFRRSLVSIEYWVETIPLLLLTLIGATAGWYPEISYSFMETGVGEQLLYWLPTLIMLPLTFLLTLWRRYEAERYWHHLKRANSTEKLYRVSRLLFRFVLIIVLYTIFYPVAPAMGLVFVSLSAFFVLLIDFLSLLGFVLAVAIFILLLCGIYTLRSISKRKKLIKRLREVSAESGYTLSEIKRPYASLFKKVKECSFTLEKDGKVFSCRLIGSPWQRAPMFFVSDSLAYFRHRIGTKNHHLTLLSTFEYDFEGDGDKIILVNPVPRRIYVSNDERLEGNYDVDPSVSTTAYAGHERAPYLALRHGLRKNAKSVRELVPGDKIWGYAIYNTTSFISAIDRKCLGRYNGMFE